jgi:hypothetical protein
VRYLIPGTFLAIVSPRCVTLVTFSYKVGGAPIASMPASLSVLASVEVEYITLPGWTEPLASCKVYHPALALAGSLPTLFAADVRRAAKERAGLREVVSSAAAASWVPLLP